eukprot:CAMPEP_0172511294 /NCGR_PEP_ID=MMETSP1066-20121228/235247_1 /TAXON_ID=671091 /ORGANISM="Coscinodiscus wailesii, Strain CCMP2513" /LENGTH=201 /DNA_ID=CAMNT_0013290605 /DNA_START=384 /DNA_END=989 /DNA_ORIENTATION=+
MKLVDDATHAVAITSVPACSLLRAHFREEISLTIGSSGELLSVILTPLISPLAPKTCDVDLTTDDGEGDATRPALFETSASFVTSTPSMTLPVILPTMKPPPGLRFFDVKKSRIEGVEGDERLNQSFLRKYWYIFLPMLIMSLLGGAEEEQQVRRGVPPSASAGAGGGGGGASAGPVGAGSAAVAGVAVAGGAPKRRGKRG